MKQLSPSVRVEEVSKRYGKVVALDRVSFAVEPGEVFGITGPSGSGKTTLLRCIAGLEVPDSGLVYCNGMPVTTPDPDVGLVFQRAYLWPHMTVLENVKLSQVVAAKRTVDEATERAVMLLENLGIQDKKDELPEVLSGGQTQRVSIARMLATDPSIMLLDEVTTGLDDELVAGLQGIIRSLARIGKTLVVVSHDMGFLREIARRTARIVRGAIAVEHRGE